MRGKVIWIAFTLTLGLSLLNNNSIAQVTIGTTVNCGPPVIKSVAEILAYESQHPVDYSTRRPLRRENDLELNKAPVSNSPFVSSYANPAFFPSTTQPLSPGSIGSTQTMWSNFLSTWGGFTSIAGSESNFVPPDCNGDVGPTQVITVINTRLKVFNKPLVTVAAVTTSTGASTIPLANTLTFDLSNLFGVSISDTHIRYDRLSGRWFLVAIDLTATNNKCYLAVSNGSAISNISNFAVYSFVESIGGGNAGDFFDYPTLGVDKNAVYIGSVMFNPNVYTGANLYIIKKSDLFIAVPVLTVTAFPHGTGAGKSGATATLGISVPQGVQNDDPASTEGYFVGSSNAAFSTVVMKRISNPGGSPTLSSDITLTVPTTAAPIAQLTKFNNSTTPLDAIDDRMFAAMIMKNKLTGVNTLWTAHNIEVNTAGIGTAGGGRNGSRWYEIGNLTATPTLVQSGTVFDAAATTPRGYFIPGIAMSGQGHSILGSSSTAANQFADCGFVGRYRTDAGGTLQNYTFATTASTNYKPADGTTHRWGDFSQTVIDPLDNMTMWTFQDFATEVNTWGIRAIQIKAPAPPTATVTGVPSNFCGAAVAVTINGTSVNNTEFFDPGADAGGPGFTRLNVTCSGAVAVSNVAFVSPTQVTCTINTAGKAAGIYTLTITNPDGQTTTATFTLTGSCSALPLRLIDFTGILVNKEVQLTWNTMDEINMKGYIIEKSAEGIQFAFFNELTAKGNNLYALSTYRMTDPHPYPGNTYYRLKLINTDGSFIYSQVVKIKTATKPIMITKVFPNPTKHNVSLEIFAERTQAIQVRVFDPTGKMVLADKIFLVAGLNEHILPLNGVSAGIYFIRLSDDKGIVVEVIKLIKE